MAETPLKRRRELTGDAANSGDSDLETTKHQKQETNQDLLLDFFTNLSSDPFLDFNPQPESDPDHNPNPNKDLLQDDDDEKESVIRHLLEASDDELGIPSRVDGGGDGGDGGGGGGSDDVAGGYFGDFEFGLGDGLWELEDEVANANYYYTLLQSELFMQ
ncbi:hypothetical protein QVD17_21150 [Tagetes erecta]|uniref:Uncharacterized protein n=1 Tax=Tagetes erecta TaxID=13708 RepID=A0AAD8NYU4_TARER|nr:hypothetical protein QVD17_21150 [Tagetes erecta]